MPKGKPWSVDDERKLKEWFKSGIKDFSILSSSFDGKYSPNAVYQKLLDLGLISKEEEVRKKRPSSSTALKLPAELPSVEETLKTLAAALKALETSRLEKSEVLRLRGIISGCKIYKELFADFLNYRELEQRLIELEGKYAALVKKAP